MAERERDRLQGAGSPGPPLEAREGAFPADYGVLGEIGPWARELAVVAGAMAVINHPINAKVPTLVICGVRDV